MNLNVDRMRKYNRSKGALPRITRDGNSSVPPPAVIVVRDMAGNEIVVR